MEKNQSPIEVPERFLYHSFPRRWRLDSKRDPLLEREKGLSILESIVKSGLLLTPETHDWREQRRTNSGEAFLSEPLKITQKYCSFTFLKPSKLKEHSKLFGSFALEFKIDTLRQLGGIPVFYLPKALIENIGLESLAASYIFRLGEIQTLLHRLAKFEEEAENSPNKEETLLLKKNDLIQGPMRITFGGIEDLIAVLRLPPKDGGEPAQPIHILRNALQAFSGYFYPTEDISHTGALGYYHQREWRIVANISQDGQELTRELNETEKERLLELDQEFFNKEEEYHTGNYPRIYQCRIFPELDGKPIIQYVNRVIVRRDAMDEVSSILQTEKVVPNVEALEAL